MLLTNTKQLNCRLSLERQAMSFHQNRKRIQLNMDQLHGYHFVIRGINMAAVRSCESRQYFIKKKQQQQQLKLYDK